LRVGVLGFFEENIGVRELWKKRRNRDKKIPRKE